MPVAGQLDPTGAGDQLGEGDGRVPCEDGIAACDGSTSVGAEITGRAPRMSLSKFISMSARAIRGDIEYRSSLARRSMSESLSTRTSAAMTSPEPQASWIHGSSAGADLLARGRARAARPQHQRRHPIRVRRREERRHGRAFGDADQRRSFDPFGIHDHAQVVHALLERGRFRDAIREPDAPLLDLRDAREAREPIEDPAAERRLPHQLEVRGEPGRDHDVDRPAAAPAVGDVHVARIRVPGFGPLHGRDCRRDSSGRGEGRRKLPPTRSLRGETRAQRPLVSGDPVRMLSGRAGDAGGSCGCDRGVGRRRRRGLVARILMRAVTLSAGHDGEFTLVGSFFIVLIYAVAMIPGAVVAAFTTRWWRWLVAAGGSLFLCFPAVGVASEEIGSTDGLSILRWVLLVITSLAVFATIAIVPVVTIALVNSRRRPAPARRVEFADA